MRRTVQSVRVIDPRRVVGLLVVVASVACSRQAEVSPRYPVPARVGSIVSDDDAFARFATVPRSDLLAGTRSADPVVAVESIEEDAGRLYGSLTDALVRGASALDCSSELAFTHFLDQVVSTTSGHSRDSRSQIACSSPNSPFPKTTLSVEIGRSKTVCSCSEADFWLMGCAAI